MDFNIEMRELVDKLNKCCDSYYNYNNSLLSDAEYDELFDKLKTMEEKTGIVYGDSPTRRAGYEVLNELPKVKHTIPLLSLDKTKDLDEAIKFAQDKEVFFSVKCDGLTCKLVYENGELIQASTRGDGEIGSNITHNAKTFSNVPITISYKGHLVIVGEAVIPENYLDVINASLPDGVEPYSTVRNLVSGSVSLLDSAECAKRHVHFFAFNVLEGLEEIDDKISQFAFVKNLGFDIVPNISVKGFNTLNKEEAKDIIKDIVKKIHELADERHIPCDGVVERFNSESFSKTCGRTQHHYLYGKAIKDIDEKYDSVLRDIIWETSRTGVIYPVAIYDEVNIDGAKLTRCSLNNVSFIKSRKLGIGDKIKVSRRNMVIPYLEENVTCSNTYKIPDICPSCGSKAHIEVSPLGVETLNCSNHLCPSQLLNKFIFSTSKKCLDINGLSEATLATLIEKGWLKDLKDLYHLDRYRSEFIKTDGLGEKSYEKLISAIKKSREIHFDRFICALGIEGIGKSASKIISDKCNGRFENLLNLCGEKFDFSELEGFGGTSNNAIYDWFYAYMESQTQNKPSPYLDLGLYEEMRIIEEQTGIATTPINTDSIFNGKTFVITGSFSIGSRDELTKMIENNGGKSSSSVSKKTDFLVVGEKAGSKLTKAQELGVRCIEEIELKSILNL